jgi:thiol-disulfide isomerase/thioredoxin
MRYRLTLLLFLACVLMSSGCTQIGVPSERVTCEHAGFVITGMRYEAGNVNSIVVEANNTGKRDLALYARINYGDGSIDTRDPELYLSANEGPMTFTINGVRNGVERVSLIASDCLDMMDYVDRKDITGIENEPVRLEDIDTPTFTYTNDNICRDGGKPIIMLFSATGNSHCEWIADTYDPVVREYADNGKIVAYHWQTDTRDNTLTSATETQISEIEDFFYNKYSPERTVPTFIFGCSFTRIGNGYESQNDTKAEEEEFRTIIDALISQ